MTAGCHQLHLVRLRATLLVFFPCGPGACSPAASFWPCWECCACRRRPCVNAGLRLCLAASAARCWLSARCFCTCCLNFCPSSRCCCSRCSAVGKACRSWPSLSGHALQGLSGALSHSWPVKNSKVIIQIQSAPIRTPSTIYIFQGVWARRTPQKQYFCGVIYCLYLMLKTL